MNNPYSAPVAWLDGESGTDHMPGGGIQSCRSYRLISSTHPVVVFEHIIVCLGSGRNGEDIRGEKSQVFLVKMQLWKLRGVVELNTNSFSVSSAWLLIRSEL